MTDSSESVGATDCYMLSDRKELALARLLEGATHGEAAEVAGVHRVTVTRWRREDPVFIAEHNRRQAELSEGVMIRLRRLILKALAVMDAGLDAEAEGSGTTLSMKLISLMGARGVTEPAQVGPTDPESVQVGILADEETMFAVLKHLGVTKYDGVANRGMED
jgi:hypothetical protein